MMNVNYLYAHKPPTLTDNNVGIIDKLKTNKREVGHILCTDICLHVSGMSRLHHLSNILIDRQMSTSIYQLGTVLSLTYPCSGTYGRSVIAKTKTSVLVRDSFESNPGNMSA